ncbi:MAG TPA: hypothetical protein VGM30_24415 [Puia sp.]|jgi:hypothetical protein
MPAGKKNTTRKRLKKRTQTTIFVIETQIAAKDTSFPDKVARANEILSKTKFHDPKLFFGD